MVLLKYIALFSRGNGDNGLPRLFYLKDDKSGPQFLSKQIEFQFLLHFSIIFILCQRSPFRF